MDPGKFLVIVLRKLFQESDLANIKQILYIQSMGPLIQVSSYMGLSYRKFTYFKQRPTLHAKEVNNGFATGRIITSAMGCMNTSEMCKMYSVPCFMTSSRQTLNLELFVKLKVHTYTCPLCRSINSRQCVRGEERDEELQ